MRGAISRRALIRSAVCSGAATAGLTGSRRSSAIDSNQLPGKIAFVRNRSIWTWSAEDGAKELLLADNISDPRWGPDGNALLYVRMQNSYSDLYTYDLITGTETQRTFHQPFDEVGSFDYAINSSWALDPDWGRNGLIAFASDSVGSGGLLSLWLMASPAEQPYLALQTVQEEDIAGVALAPHEAVASYTVRARVGDGTFNTYVALRDLNNGATAPIAESSGDIFDSAISPDGAWVAITIRDESGVTDIWLVDRATGERRRGTRDQNAMAPRWSDDGNWFAYIKEDNYQFEIWAGGFSRGRIRDASKIYDEGGIDPQSGLSWWMDTGTEVASPEQ